MKDYKGILLDLDNTLYSYSHPHEIALETTLTYMQELLNVDLPKLYNLYREARHHIHLLLKNTAASHNRLLYFQTMMEILSLKPFELPHRLYTLYWSTFLDNMTLSAGVTEFLSRLNGLPVCLVTDMTADVQHQKIRKLGLEPFIDAMVTSEEVGQEKPHPKIFQRALKKINLKAHEVCMIGDSYEKDILGALELGIPAYWLTPAPQELSLPDQCTSFTHFDGLQSKPARI